MAQESLDFFASDTFQTYTTTFPFRTRRKSSVVPGATRHSAIYSTSTTVLHDTLLSFLSYIKTYNIPILPVTKPDIRSVLGEGASFLVNGAEVPKKYVDPATGKTFPQGTIVALKRAKLLHGMEDFVGDRIRVIFNELLTMNHAPLAAHPNIVNLLGIGFETEGPSDAQNAIPVLIPECAELGNLAETLETARKEGRPLSFHQKIALCLDVAHGLEVLHACDIVHGDVKCENVLIFEKERHDGQEGPESFQLYCKLTDFGVSRLPTGELVLGGSRPWQAPECHRGAYLKIEEAKRTDIYSFGMLLWRVCLDGDPFQSLGDFEGITPRERRQKRNDAITKKKDEDRLVQHVCTSLALSEKFSRPQLEILCEVINVTLLKDAGRRELDMTRIIRLLTPDNWFAARHPLAPARMPIDVHTHLLDMEKWHSEFEGVSPVVQSYIVKGFRDYALATDDSRSDSEERKSAAAYQLAVCCANEFGGKFHPKECVKWLTFAAERGSQKAQDALPRMLEAFPEDSTPFKNPWSTGDENASLLGSSWASEFPGETSKSPAAVNKPSTVDAEVTYLAAAENCDYRAMRALLDAYVKPSVSIDGVSPLHFLSSWDPTKAEDLGRRLIDAGADINAVAAHGPTIGGTPLMWSVHGDHIEQTMVLVKLGADPMKGTTKGEDALSLAAKLHLAEHLRLLLEYTRPAHVRGHLSRLVGAAAGGESRFTRINRHSTKWQTAADETFKLLFDWNALFPDSADFRTLVLPAIFRGLNSSYGRMNTDVQISFIKKCAIESPRMSGLLRESVVNYNLELFDALLEYGVPVAETFENGKTLLHLCARIPDHSVAAVDFAPRLLKLGAVLDSRDQNGITPWMDSILERKWDLADLLMKEGANPLATDIDGYNAMGLCIKAINLGSIKYLLKYSAKKETIQQNSFLVNPEKSVSALQLAAALSLPRAHGMKIEVMGTFLIILATFAGDPAQLNFRSSGILTDATALDIAAAKGNVHAVKSLMKRGALRPNAERASECAQARLVASHDFMQKTNLERCIYIIQNWEKDQTQRLADDWTNLRTIDESKVNSSWEIVVWTYKSRKGLRKEDSRQQEPQKL